jgi:hypothetical protein
VKRNYRISTHCGGKQLKRWGEQNAETRDPSIHNPVTEVLTDGKYYISFRYKNGKKADLDLGQKWYERTKVFKVPVGQVL